MNATIVSDIMADLLQACLDAYAAQDGPNRPQRTFLSWSLPPDLGTERLTVAFAGISATHPHPLPQLRAIKTTVTPSLAVQIEVVRACWPVPQSTGPNTSLPPPAAFTKATNLLAQDAAIVFGWIADLAAKGGLLPSAPTINTSADVGFSPMVPIAPSGTLAGLRFPLSIKLP